MEGFHEFLARVALAAAGPFGFALAGGYAVQENGLVSRASEDVDIFTAWSRRGEFDAGVSAVVDAYSARGLSVTVISRYDTFAGLVVSDGERISKVELAADWRAKEPVMLSVGPVLHPDDAIANKMIALYGRAQARDFVDVDAAILSGRYTHERLLQLAEQADGGFDVVMFGTALARVDVLPLREFERYGLNAQDLDALRTRFSAWRAAVVSDR